MHRILALFVVLAAGVSLFASPSITAAQTQPAAVDRDAIWPWELKMPADIQAEIDAEKKPRVPILVWVPPGSEQVRAMLLIVDNSDSKEFGQSPAVRAVAAKHDMAVVYFRWGVESHMDRVQDIFDGIAEQTGMPGFKNAPWITFGKSSRGKFPYYMAWQFPDRTIATISYHAETPSWPMADWSNIEDQSILHVSANGEVEWGGTFAIHVRPSLLNYRLHSNVLPHQIVARGVGHGDYVDASGSPGWGKSTGLETSVQDVWRYLALFIDKAISLRLPEDADSTDGPAKLRQVDPDKGYLIEPFALEDTLRRSRLDLVKSEDGYTVNPGEEGGKDSPPKLNGYAEIAPAADYTPAPGVPVVDLEPGKSPTQWLLTKGLPFAMQTDPMQDVSAFTDLRPAPGDTLDIDSQEATFTLIDPKEIGRREGIERGIAMKGGLTPKNNEITVLGYTVLKVDKAQAVKISAGHSLAVRIQVVLNGQPVDDRQVVQLQPGLYPMLFVLRMKSVTWGEVEPALTAATDEEVAAARESQAAKSQKEAEFQARFADGPLDPWTYIHPAAEVEQSNRRHMLWLPDRELAEAWIKLHTPPAKSE